MFLVLSLSLKAFPQTSISKSNPDTGLNADDLGRIENCWRTNLQKLAHLLQITAESSVSLQKGSGESFFSFSFDHVCLLSLRPDWGGLCRVGFFPPLVWVTAAKQSENDGKVNVCCVRLMYESRKWILQRRTGSRLRCLWAATCPTAAKKRQIRPPV